jgi:hypothetical protein
MFKNHFNLFISTVAVSNASGQVDVDFNTVIGPVSASGTATTKEALKFRFVAYGSPGGTGMPYCCR